MVRDNHDSSHYRYPRELNIEEEDTELDVINRLVDIIRNFDPDILAGYEVQNASLGYIIERARFHFGIHTQR